MKKIIPHELENEHFSVILKEIQSNSTIQNNLKNILENRKITEGKYEILTTISSCFISQKMFYYQKPLKI